MSVACLVQVLLTDDVSDGRFRRSDARRSVGNE